MSWLILLGIIIVLAFGFVVLFGAPFLPTFEKQINTALDMLELKPGQSMLELGCGDGRVLKKAAERGLVAVGYELNPFLVLLAKVNTWKYRGKVRVRWGNYWHKTWPTADGIFTFLLPKYMIKLDKKIIQEFSKPVKLVSFAFEIPKRKAVREQDGVFLYLYNTKQ